MQLKRVVVTGLGALTPIGNNVSDYWNNLLAGVSGAAPITHFDASKFKTRFACEVKGFNVDDFIDKKESRKMDPFTHFGIVAADQAIEDAGLNTDTVDKDRIGVIFGSGIGGIKIFQEEITNFNQGDGTPRFNPFFIPKMIIDIVPGHISMKHGFRGPNFAVVSACATGNNALIDAFNYVRLGMANAIVCGGTESAITPAGVGGFNACRAMSERNDSPTTASRPFDKERDGFVLGEGAGCIILEEYEHAKARGAKIYCEMVGGGASADAYHLTAPHPEGLGVINVLKNVLQDANMKPSEIDYINVHGTSTPAGDPAELKAIQKVFGEDAYRLNISSTKSMTGHLLGAAGAIEGIASVLSLVNQIVPPTINFSVPDEAIDQKLNLTVNKPQKRVINAVISNTFGFGGHNASVLFRKI
ncbi:MAG: beta-ketoacyl-[acyl-carrier-protein] synthase II [Cytophagales bacterium]|nr:MAG: beta-ketoacyl-[acyl-carrier-protein] synthase II [Cytophagales bacterium]